MRKTVYYLCFMMATILALSAPSLIYAAPPDVNAPLIGVPTLQPSSPTPSDPVTVSVNVTDDRSGVGNVTIVYTTDNWQSVNITVLASYNIATETATAQIPALSNGGHVAFYVVAFDNHGNRAVNNNSGTYFGYDVPAPPFASTTNAWVTAAIILGAIGAFAAILVHYVIKRPRPGPQRTGSYP